MVATPHCCSTACRQEWSRYALESLPERKTRAAFASLLVLVLLLRLLLVLVHMSPSCGVICGEGKRLLMSLRFGTPSTDRLLLALALAWSSSVCPCLGFVAESSATTSFVSCARNESMVSLVMLLLLSIMLLLLLALRLLLTQLSCLPMHKSRFISVSRDCCAVISALNCGLVDAVAHPAFADSVAPFTTARRTPAFMLPWLWSTRA